MVGDLETTQTKDVRGKEKFLIEKDTQLQDT